jgi:ATP-dependent Lhr-like helicase
VLQQEILPARVESFRSSHLDELCAAGEVVWQGYESLGPNDGRIGLFLAADFATLAPEPAVVEDPLGGQLEDLLRQRGALFFEQMTDAVKGFAPDLLAALWQLVWAGRVTNDTLAPLRSRQHGAVPTRPRFGPAAQRLRGRRRARLPGSEGRWSLLARPADAPPTPTERQTALARQLIERYGVVTRATVARESVVGGFANLYPVLKAIEQAGQIRRGYFVAGLGGAQFAAPDADQQLRARPPDDQPPTVLSLAATDPANAYGATLPWPAGRGDGARPQRVAGALVLIRDGQLIGYLSRTRHQLLTWSPAEQADAAATQAALVATLAEMARPGAPILLRQIDGQPAWQSNLAADLLAAGFTSTSQGLLRRAIPTGRNQTNA